MTTPLGRQVSLAISASVLGILDGSPNALPRISPTFECFWGDIVVNCSMMGSFVCSRASLLQ